jgi:hypothetical protein
MVSGNPTSVRLSTSVSRSHRPASSGYRTSLSAGLGLPPRATGRFSYRESVLQSSPLGCRTSFARGGQHRRKLALRDRFAWRAAGAAALGRSRFALASVRCRGEQRLALQVLLKASPARTRYGTQCAGQHSSPSDAFADSSASAATTPTITVSLPPAPGRFAPKPDGLQKPAHQAPQTAEIRGPRAPGASLEGPPARQEP